MTVIKKWLQWSHSKAIDHPSMQSLKHKHNVKQNKIGFSHIKKCLLPLGICIPPLEFLSLRMCTKVIYSLVYSLLYSPPFWHEYTNGPRRMRKINEDKNKDNDAWGVQDEWEMKLKQKTKYLKNTILQSI